MKKKLITSVLMLVLSFSMLSGATFAWFSITTQVQIDDMELRVQTVGTIVLRTYDHATGDANERAYGTSIAIPTDAMEGARGTGFRRSGLEPVALYDSSGLTVDGNEWSDNTAAGGDNTSEDIPETTDIDGVAAAITDSGHDLFYKAFEQEDTNDEYSWAEERNHYGRWDIDVVSLDSDNDVSISTPEGQTFLRINGEWDGAVVGEISSFGAIDPDQRKRDFLRAFEIYVVEMTPDTTDFGDPTPEFDSSTGTDPLLGYDIVSHGTFDTHKNESDADVEGDTFAIDWSELSLGTFATDTPRYFSLVYFLNGEAGAHHAENQNHLSGLDVSINLQLEVDEEEVV